MSKKIDVIVAALDEELKSLRGKMQIEASHTCDACHIVEGKLGERDIVLMRTGVGAKQVRKSFETLLTHYEPISILGIGFCGATDPALNVGDLVIADAIRTLDEERSLFLKTELVKRATMLCEESRLRYKQGKILMSNRVIKSQHEKAYLGTSHSGLAVDMESFALTEISEQQKIPLCIVRAVFDPLECELPDVESSLDIAGNPKPLSFLRFLAQHPKSLFKLPEMMYSAQKAREVLTQFVEVWFHAKTT